MTISTLDVNSLKDSEIKDFLHSFIDKAKNRKQLIRYVEALKQTVDGDVLFGEDYMPELKAQIEMALQKSFKPKKEVDMDAVMQKYAKGKKSSKLSIFDKQKEIDDCPF